MESNMEMLNAAMTKIIEFCAGQDCEISDLEKRILKLEAKIKGDTPNGTELAHIFALIMDIQERIACNHNIMSEKMEAMCREIQVIHKQQSDILANILITQ